MSQVAFFKASLLVLGFAVLTLAMHSSVHSSCLCDEDDGVKYHPKLDSFKCFPRALNLILVLTATITLTLSTCSYLACKRPNGTSKQRNAITDIVYHILAAISMLAASTWYVYSQQTVKTLRHMESSGNHDWCEYEKLVTGILGLLEALAYIITAYLLYKTWKPSSDNSAPTEATTKQLVFLPNGSIKLVTVDQTNAVVGNHYVLNNNYRARVPTTDDVHDARMY